MIFGFFRFVKEKHYGKTKSRIQGKINTKAVANGSKGEFKTNLLGRNEKPGGDFGYHFYRWSLVSFVIMKLVVSLFMVIQC